MNISAQGKSYVFRTTIEKILQLRHDVLRAGLPFETAHFDGDEDPDTWHIGSFLVDDYGNQTGDALCCASYMLNEWEGKPAWQLRGMATKPALQGYGLGKQLVGAAEKLIGASSPVHAFWCNAREPAVGFYEKQGWKIVSDVFEIPTAGPHRKMVKLFE